MFCTCLRLLFVRVRRSRGCQRSELISQLLSKNAELVIFRVAQVCIQTSFFANGAQCLCRCADLKFAAKDITEDISALDIRGPGPLRLVT